MTLNPVKDNTLYEPIQQDTFADMSDGVGPTMFAGKVKDALNQSGQVALRRAVLEFDVASAVPAGATIDSVQLTLYCDKVGSTTSFNVTRGPSFGSSSSQPSSRMVSAAGSSVLHSSRNTVGMLRGSRGLRRTTW